MRAKYNIKVSEFEISITKFCLCITAFSSITLSDNSSLISLFSAISSILPFTSVISTLSGISFFNYSTLNIMISCFLMIVVCVIGIVNQRSVQMNFVGGVLLCLLLYEVIHCMIFTGITRIYLYKPLFYLSLLIVLYLLKDDIDDIFNFMMKLFRIYAFITCVIVIYNFILKSGSVHVYFGFDYFRINRASGIDYDTDITCTVLALGIWQRIVSKEWKLKKIAVMMLFVISGFMTGSRLFYLLLLVIVALKLILGNKMNGVRMMVISLGIIAISFLVFAIFQNSIIVFFDDASRIEKYKTALMLFTENPLIGSGIDSYSSFEKQLGGGGTNPHNYCLEMMVSYGLIGISLFIIPVICSFRTAHKYQNLLMIGAINIWIIGSMVVSINASLFICNLLIVCGVYLSKYKQFKVEQEL